MDSQTGEERDEDVYRCIIRIERDAEEHDCFSVVVMRLADGGGEEGEAGTGGTGGEYEETFSEDFRIAPNDSFETSDEAARGDYMR